MFSTGIGMAMTNLTQVEKLGHKTKVHTLAVLKPLPEELLRTGQYTVSQFPYPEIIYPLEIGYALRADSCEVLPQTNTDKPLPDTKRTAALQQSQTLQEKSTHPMPELSPGPGDDSSVSVGSPGHLGERSKKTVVAPTGDNVEQAALSRVSSELRQRKEFEIEASRRPRKALSASELKAVRLFAILRLNPGDNPWDLGSYLLNFETVMGENVFDWFLPFRRSPCCNHEDPESYYRIGPVVKLARAKAFSMDAKDPGAKVNPKMSERYQNDAEAGCPGREPTEGHSLLSNHEHAISPNAQIEMNNLSGYPPQQQPG
jgi:palmitoyltransferase